MLSYFLILHHVLCLMVMETGQGAQGVWARWKTGRENHQTAWVSAAGRGDGSCGAPWGDARRGGGSQGKGDHRELGVPPPNTPAGSAGKSNPGRFWMTRSGSRDLQSLTRCQQSPAAGSERAVTIFGSAAGQEAAAEASPPPCHADNVSEPFPGQCLSPLRDSIPALPGSVPAFPGTVSDPSPGQRPAIPGTVSEPSPGQCPSPPQDSAQPSPVQCPALPGTPLLCPAPKLG